MSNRRFVNSIRFKLFIVFFAVVAGLQGIFLVFNAQALETVLVYGDKMEMSKLLVRYLAETQQIPELSVEAKEILLAQLAYEWDGNLTFIDSRTGDFKSTLPTRGMRGGMMDQRGNLAREVAKQYESLKPGEVASLVRQDRTGKEALVIYVGKVNAHQLIFSEKPLSVLRESKKLVSRYLMISGFLTVLIGSVAILILSKKLTQPIIEIEEQANRIASQDFGTPNRVSQTDEIGSLGRAVNQIEIELSETINALNNANGKLKDEIENERRLEQLRRLFISNVSHELKTPMSMIVGYADGLKFGIANNPESVAYYCDVILSESEKMNTLISDLLDMSAYQEGRLPIQLKPVNLSALVQNTVGLFRAQALERDIELKSHIDDNVLVSGDAFRLEQVIRNILSNAFKHVNEVGKIDLELSGDGRKLVKLVVTNTGDPIPSEELEAIWMSFYRGSQAREKQLEGFGIGLALVKEIILKHNGTVAVKNVAQGVSFIIELPMTLIDNEEDHHGSV